VPDDRELMRMHVDALFTHDVRGRMVRVNEPGGRPAPRLFLGRTAHGSVWRFRHDVDDGLARALEALCQAEAPGDERLEPPHGADPYRELLARAAPAEVAWAGPAFVVPPGVAAASGTVRVTEGNAGLLRPHLEDWLGDVATGQPLFAALHDGRAVAVCCSVRLTPAAHEAGVETAPGFRRRGYAASAVRAWAAAVREQGIVPLYSTSWENAASRALAARLGLRRFGAVLQIT
jgi:hypothetical protein